MIYYFVRHPVAANILMIAACTLGLAVVFGIERESFPEFTPSRVSVTVLYPGASAIDVDEQVCTKIDHALNDIDSLDSIECKSTEGRAAAILTMSENGDISQFFNSILSEVQAISDLPTDAEEPTVAVSGREENICILAISGIDNQHDLLRYADQLAAQISNLTLIEKAEVGGISQQEIRVAIDLAALRRFNLSSRNIFEAINARSFDQPLGMARMKDAELTLRYKGTSRSVEALESITIRKTDDGGVVRLTDVAEVFLADKDPEIRSILDGRRAATINILKLKSADSIYAFEELSHFIRKEQENLYPPFNITVINNSTKNILERIHVVSQNMGVGVVLILIVMATVFSFREAFWIAATLPISFLGAFFILNAMDITINMISLIAMLMAVGLIMDDSIVIADNIDKWRDRLNLGDSSARGVYEVAPGVLSSFLTTACVFTPLMFLSGEIGEILEVVPAVLLVVLGVSILEAFLVLPHHLSYASSGRGKQADRLAPHVINWARDRIIVPIVSILIRWRYLTLGLTFAALIVSMGLITGGYVKVIGFPTIEGDTIEARIALEYGTPLTQTEKVADQLIRALNKVDSELTPFTEMKQPLVKRILVRFSSNADVHSNGPHTFTITVDLLSSELRNITANEVAELWEKQTGQINDISQSRFIQTAIGPGGADLDVKLSSNNLIQLEEASRYLLTKLIARDEITSAYQDFNTNQRVIQIILSDFGNSTGLTAQDVSGQLRSAFSGDEIDRFSIGFTDLSIKVGLGDSISEIEDVKSFPIIMPDDSVTNLSQVADIMYVNAYSQITRQNRSAVARIIGQIDRNATTSTAVSRQIQEIYAPLMKRLFPEVSVSLGGAAAAQQETQSSIFSSLIIGIVGVYLILAFQFKSYALPMIVMLSIPFAIIGVVLGHIMVGVDLSMPSFIGFASLAGIVVNNSILFFTFFESESEESAIQGAIEAVRNRFRPVLLSFLTTFVGLLPIIFESSPQAQTMIPLVTSVAFGLLSSTVLTIFVLPCALVAYFDWLSLAKWRAVSLKRSTVK